MSHKATNWAFEQRGLKSTAWRLLAVLADCHNPSYGCFPKQTTLSDRTELDRSTVNRQLDVLEKKGLIIRIKRWDNFTKKQTSTRYVLAFEDEFEKLKAESQNATQENNQAESQNPPELSRKNDDSRVANCDSYNPVRETVTEPVIGEAREREKDLDDKTQVEKSEQVDDPKKFEARVKKLGANHKNFINQSTQSAVNAFAKLTDAERLEAENRHADYIAFCKGRDPVYLSTYFKEKKWTDLPAKPVVTDEQKKIEQSLAAPLSVPWLACRMVQLMRGQEVEGVPCTSDPFRAMKEKAWPRLSEFDKTISQNVSKQLPERFHAAKDAMEWVSADSDVWQEWVKMFDRSNWPYVPHMLEKDGLWFPKGGPDQLPAFAEKMGVEWVS